MVHFKFLGSCLNFFFYNRLDRADWQQFLGVLEFEVVELQIRVDKCVDIVEGFKVRLSIFCCKRRLLQLTRILFPQLIELTTE